MKCAVGKRLARQAGTAAVEFSIIVLFFLMLIFATLELARVEYLVNTLMEVTRRATCGAANVDFTNDAEVRKVQANAVFRDARGPLALGDPVHADHVAIDYLSVDRDTMELRHVAALPASPAENRLNCIANPYANNCIRFVRARICAETDNAGNCEPLRYQKVFPFLDLSGARMPTAETMVPAGSLGQTAAATSCS